MEFNATAYRILKYLKEVMGKLLLNKNEIIKSINCRDRDDFDDAVSLLEKQKFIEAGKTDISITPEGKSYVEKIESQREASAYEFVFKDFDYAVIKFLYENNWGVRLNEFPTIIDKKAPDVGMMNSGNLYQYLEFERDFIKEKNDYYTLTDKGIQHYFIETERKEKEEERNHEGKLLVGHIGDNVFHKALKNSPVAGINTNINEPQKDSWWQKILGDIRGHIVGYLIAVIIGFLTGKSCNNHSSQMQRGKLQSPIDSVK